VAITVVVNQDHGVVRRRNMQAYSFYSDLSYFPWPLDPHPQITLLDVALHRLELCHCFTEAVFQPVAMPVEHINDVRAPRIA